jgi:hypothetical protein
MTLSWCSARAALGYSWLVTVPKPSACAYCYRDHGTGAYGEGRTMTTAGRAYVVRDADGEPGEVTQVYAYTLKGLTTALEDARFRSFHGAPQAVVVMRDGHSVVIRRFELGREVPLAPS